MMTVYVLDQHVLRPIEQKPDAALPADAVWIDLLEPSKEEELRVENYLNIDAPTREEMQEIEPSSRIYQEGEARFMTATVAATMDSDVPVSAAVTFIRAGRALVTLRYENPKPFQTFATRVTRQAGLATTGDQVMLGLLDAIVDRCADVLEKQAAELDQLSRKIFRAKQKSVENDEEPTDLEAVLRQLGRSDDVISKVRDSLGSIVRIITYLAQVASEEKGSKDTRLRLKSLARDASSLSEHAAFIAHKTNFLLDATLGLINIAQTTIIKIFSVAAVVFLPPTLVASIYGMNFKVLPELDWTYGYVWALFLMVLSAILPYLFFKRRGWL